MLREVASFLWWSFLVPLLLFNLLFLCCSSKRTVWRSPSWPAVPPPEALEEQEAEDSLDETETTSFTSCSREDGIVARDVRPNSTSSSNGTSRSSSSEASFRRRRIPAKRDFQGDCSRSSSSNSTNNSSSISRRSSKKEWKRDRSLLARARTYAALRITSFFLPAMWLLNVFLMQQLLKRSMQLLLLQEQHWGVSDFLLAFYGLYAVLWIFWGEDLANLLGLPSAAVRRLRLWREAAEYFPISVVTETSDAEYPTDKSYLIGFHPHGVMSFSCTLAWGILSDWEWLDVRRLLAGIDYRIATLAINLRLPFWGHLLQAVGFISCSKSSIKGFVSRGPGRAVLVVIGGAKEAFWAGAGRNDLVLWRRKGFFEIALQTGSWLIPVFSLGENEMYERIGGEGLVVRAFNALSRKTMALFGFCLPPFHGRGLLQLTMPKRVKILQLIGDPLPCPCIPHPTQQDIDELRQRYCEAVYRLYKKARKAYGPDGHFEDLRIVE